MSRSIVVSFVLGFAISAAILLFVLPIREYSSQWDGESLKVILFAHSSAYGLFLEEHGDATLPANHVQFLENYKVDLVRSGDKYVVRYHPWDQRVRGGAYNIVVSNNNGQLMLEKVVIEP